MFKIYIGSNETHGLTKIGITRNDPKGRMKDYIRHHNLPTEGWGRTLSFNLNTDNPAVARKIERTAHRYLIDLGRRGALIGGKGAREVFKASGKGSWFILMAIVKASGIYEPKNKKKA